MTAPFSHLLYLYFSLSLILLFFYHSLCIISYLHSLQNLYPSQSLSLKSLHFLFCCSTQGTVFLNPLFSDGRVNELKGSLKHRRRRVAKGFGILCSTRESVVHVGYRVSQGNEKMKDCVLKE